MVESKIRWAKRAKLLDKCEKLHEEINSSEVLLKQMVAEIRDSRVTTMNNELEAMKEAYKAYEEKVIKCRRTFNKLRRMK